MKILLDVGKLLLANKVKKLSKLETRFITGMCLMGRKIIVDLV